ncbi:MAG: antibiotic biosynthesis monooxygenase family protein [Gammaproteobacteria bacterium]
MIREIARIHIEPARAADFLAAVATAAPLFRGSPGCRSLRIEQVIEIPGVYLLLVEWETLDDHLVGFRNSPAFQQWRALAGPFFTAPPVVEHTETCSVHF